MTSTSELEQLAEIGELEMNKESFIIKEFKSVIKTNLYNNRRDVNTLRQPSL